MSKLLNKLEIDTINDEYDLYLGEVGRWFYQVQVCNDGTVFAWRQLKKFALTDNRWCKIQLK